MPAPAVAPSAQRLAAPPGFSLRRTLDSGQAFRWTWDGQEAVGVLGRTVYRLAERDGRVAVLEPAGADAAARIGRYLWSSDPAAAQSRLAQDPELARTLTWTRGLSILAQDPWEALASFVISSFNNVNKIRLSIHRLTRRYGDALPGGHRSFPAPARLASARLDGLARCCLGYRAPRLRAVARLVADGRLDLEALRRAPHDEARARLLALPGVGEKVADCVLLFGLAQPSAFPVDVWVQRAVSRRFFGGRTVRPRDARAWGRDRWGDAAGYAQQHLFEFERLHHRRGRA